MKRLLLVKEVAAELRCHERTVRRMAEDGDLKALKVRGSLRIVAESLTAYFERMQVEYAETNGIEKFYGTDLDNSDK